MSQLGNEDGPALVQLVAEAGVEMLESVCLGLNVHPANVITKKANNTDTAQFATSAKAKYTELYNRLKVIVQQADEKLKDHQANGPPLIAVDTNGTVPIDPKKQERILQLEEELEKRKATLRLLLGRLHELELLVNATAV